VRIEASLADSQKHLPESGINVYKAGAYAASHFLGLSARAALHLSLGLKTTGGRLLVVFESAQRLGSRIAVKAPEQGDGIASFVALYFRAFELGNGLPRRGLRLAAAQTCRAS